MKLLLTSLIMALALQNAVAQSVGINTNTPNSSAVLDISSTNKGVLLPKISLGSVTDKFTILNPANGMLVYNTNTQIGAEGYYYNAGTPANAFWKMIGAKLDLPFSQAGSAGGPLFYIENSENSPNAIAIAGSSEKVGVRGSSSAGIGVSGTSTNGIGVNAVSTSGLALNVNGKLRIAGNGQSPGSGKVLTSDANGNASWQTPAVYIVAFSDVGINGGGNINSTNGLTPVTVNFGNVAYNLGGAYLGASNTFIAPYNGIYHFDAMVEWTHADPDLEFSPSLRLVRNRNNVETELAIDFKYHVSSKHTSIVTIDCELQQGDVVFVSGVSGTNGIELETSNSTAHFNGRLLQKL